MYILSHERRPYSYVPESYIDRTDTTLVLCRGVGMRHYYVHYLTTVPIVLLDKYTQVIKSD